MECGGGGSILLQGLPVKHMPRVRQVSGRGERRAPSVMWMRLPELSRGHRAQQQLQPGEEMQSGVEINRKKATGPNSLALFFIHVVFYIF